ncbi:Cof-type HAD-IIB family hydrolase [Anaerobacillus alkaliphilus]|uniref:Cof-type HAD-IIB family hydrolase n=1 Tax=Anaerobacillus alkaliphilus TaxID=1548597 RepID=A0A4Q0VVD7_9BACI|nr:Cof-type HAD-IIB family hydrolase [Anaerobacillus alkaliphilus]RXJ02033.1 Cof-type HAD-IIB family hydrolase [Anaerobacillus alkaliphilus]
MYTMIFFDIDGTLLTEEKELPKTTKLAIKELKEKGHQVAIATGRAPFMFKDLREELKIDTYVSFNGQYVVANGEVIYKNPLHKETLKSLVEFAEAKQHGLVFMDHEDMRASIEFDPYIEESIGTLKFAHPKHDISYCEDREIYQSLLFCKDDVEHDYIVTYQDSFTFVRWHPVSTDILPVGGSKAIGIAKMLQHFNVLPDQVYAFGDGLNDVEMLSFVGNSVAMGNAHEEAKRVSKHVTKHVAEDGILHGLHLVGLLK